MSQQPDATASGVGGRHGRPWRVAGAGLVALLALVGAGLIGAALNSPDPLRPPQPSAGAAPDRPAAVNPATRPDLDAPSPTPDASGGASATPVPAGRVLTRSEPIKIMISRIGVDATIMPLGLNSDGMVQVPPLAKAELAGWYQLGPTPGEPGNSVIVGHVDSKEIGPAVFFRLGALLPGDTIEVIRRDGSLATFAVDGVKSYPKRAFPTELVYGPSEAPGLRLVTCGGDFDERTGSYPDNIIAFAKLVG
ncbi:class F sortase [Plantactinospora endophytica]|uniref:Class F sortase n=1 Tax=Plantactinospora endophytica TaxID=673535 RepID=A0ABQ4EAX7_9ACTN|nr:class F sortase [Plantactinospora endophytica]GIG91804.1 class F sortase [Plantactinospora endophytica]